MRKILTLLMLSVFAPSSLLAAPIVEEVLAALNALNPYRAYIEVSYEGGSVPGFYEVDGSEYYISVDRQELYGDKGSKCEVFNSRKEVVIDLVSADYNGNILNNPATAFDSILKYYKATIISENQDVVILDLKQNIDGANDADDTLMGLYAANVGSYVVSASTNDDYAVGTILTSNDTIDNVTLTEIVLPTVTIDFAIAATQADNYTPAV